MQQQINNGILEKASIWNPLILYKSQIFHMNVCPVRWFVMHFTNSKVTKMVYE